MQTENNEKQSEALRLADDATGQMDAINRYFRENWLDDDYPDEKIYEALNDLRRLHAENAGGNWQPRQSAPEFDGRCSEKITEESRPKRKSHR